MTTITIQPSGIQFTVNDNETILEAAERNGIDFPFRCRQGVCTSCVCKTLSGEVNYGDRDESTLMTSTDQEQRFTYCCIGYPTSDMTLHHPFIK